MISFHVDAIPDETLYSYIARCFLLSGNSNWLLYIRNIFDGQRADPRAFFPSRWSSLDRFFGCSGDSPSERLINFTLLPYYRPFLSEKGHAVLHSRRSGRRGYQSIVGTGFLSSRIKMEVQGMKYCPTCADIQIKNYGVTAWLRAHQLPLVTTCWQHCVELIFVPMNRLALRLPTGDVARKKATVLCKNSMWLAKESKALLDLNKPLLNGVFLSTSYRLQMEKNGWGRANHIRSREVSTELEDVWGADFFNSLGLAIPKGDKPSWLSILLSKQDRFSHPIAHLLLIRTLFGDVKSFFDFAHQYGIGSIKPQRCMEKIAGNMKTVRCREAYTKDLRRYLARASKPSIAQFRSKNSASYMWLYKHEKDWMDELFLRAGVVKWANSGAYRKAR